VQLEGHLSAGHTACKKAAAAAACCCAMSVLVGLPRVAALCSNLSAKSSDCTECCSSGEEAPVLCASAWDSTAEVSSWSSSEALFSVRQPGTALQRYQAGQGPTAL
jgi:transcription elongation factor